MKKEKHIWSKGPRGCSRITTASRHEKNIAKKFVSEIAYKVKQKYNPLKSMAFVEYSKMRTGCEIEVLYCGIEFSISIIASIGYMGVTMQGGEGYGRVFGSLTPKVDKIFQEINEFMYRRTMKLAMVVLQS